MTEPAGPRRRAHDPLGVLVVEDVPEINEAIQEQVVRLGHTVAGVAYTGVDAVRLVVEVQPDVVLLDLVMIDPETGREDRFAGQRATETIMRQCPRPVVWLTSYESKDATGRAASAGVAGYLVKPVEDSDLDRALILATARFDDMQALAAANDALRREVEVRSAAEKALRGSEERFRRLFDASPTAMALVGSDGRIVRANTALAELLGVSLREVEGRRFLEFAHPVERGRMEALGRRLLTEDLPVVTEDARLLAASGPEVWVRASVRLLRGHDESASNLLVVLTDISERKGLEDRLRFLSFHDPLTGLYNRTFFEEELARVGASPRHPVSVVVADLDGLKSINDRLGHGAGDETLRHAAGVLRRAFRLEDIVARIGGDEFAAMMVGADAGAANALGARLGTLAQRHVEEGCGCGLQLSFGVATVQAGGSVLEALGLADARMYESKRARRHQDSAPA